MPEQYPAWLRVDAPVRPAYPDGLSSAPRVHAALTRLSTQSPERDSAWRALLEQMRLEGLDARDTLAGLSFLEAHGHVRLTGIGAQTRIALVA